MIRVLDRDQEVTMGQLVDLSVEGLMMLAQEPVDVNRVFRMSLDVPEEIGLGHISFGAESLWVEPSHDTKTHWAGFQIIDISRDNSEKIRQLIEEFL